MQEESSKPFSDEELQVLGLQTQYFHDLLGTYSHNGYYTGRTVDVRLTPSVYAAVTNLRASLVDKELFSKSGRTFLEGVAHEFDRPRKKNELLTDDSSICVFGEVIEFLRGIADLRQGLQNGVIRVEYGTEENKKRVTSMIDESYTVACEIKQLVDNEGITALLSRLSSKGVVLSARKAYFPSDPNAEHARYLSNTLARLVCPEITE